MSTGSVDAGVRARLADVPATVPQVVLCDDEASIRKLYRRALRAYDVDLVDAVDGEECLAQVARLHPDLVVLDLTLPGRDGFDVLPEICELSPTTNVVVVSGMVTPAVIEEALGLGASACIEKVPFVSQLGAMVEELSQ